MGSVEFEIRREISLFRLAALRFSRAIAKARRLGEMGFDDNPRLPRRELLRAEESMNRQAGHMIDAMRSTIATIRDLAGGRGIDVNAGPFGVRLGGTVWAVVVPAQYEGDPDRAELVAIPVGRTIDLNVKPGVN